MNILQIISGRGVNGALVYCKILSEELARRGHQVTLICRPGSWMRTHVDSGLVRVVDSTLARFPLTELKRIADLIRRDRIELVHTHMTRGQNFGIGLKLLCNVPVIATAHNRNFELHWNFNDYVIANSKSTFQYQSRVNRVPSERMETIYCCTDFDRLTPVRPEAIDQVRQRLRLRPDDFLIGLIGEVATRKGHLQFVHALPEIVAQVPNVKVVFVGRFGRKQPHVRQIRKFLIQHGLAGRIRWIGRQSNVSDYMAASELTVVPSLQEPLGLVAIESLMAGTPVVASRTGGLTEIVRNNQTGLLVPPGDPIALARAVISLARNKDLRTQLGRQGSEFVREHFSPTTLIDQVEGVYNRVAVSRTAA